jgi:eukaryotic-like serine/threonine-protein kinase
VNTAPSVLIIDDSSDFCQLAKRFIQVEWPQAQVDSWDPPTRGRDGLTQALGKYEVVLLDYMLGTDDGLTWLRQMKQTDCPPVIFLTGHGSEAVAVEAMKLGASDYLRKHDLSKQRLTGAVAQCAAEARISAARSAAGKLKASNGTGSHATTGAPITSGRLSSSAQLVAKRQERSGAVNKIAIGGYSVVRKIGEGGMSSVYLARREEDEQQVVLKIVDAELSRNDEFLKRFIRECGIISKIESPHVARIFDQGFSADHAYLAMEYFDSGDLKARIDKGMNVQEALQVIRQLATGLRAVHESGVVHRDLKPQNILFRADGTLGIVDFGIAKHMEDKAQLTTHGQVFGTPYYMSPEQGLGKSLDARSDMYSMGIIFYEMLMSKRMYTADNAVSLVYKHIHDAIPLLPPKYARYQELLERLVAKRPSDRFADAQALLEHLRAQYEGA